MRNNLGLTRRNFLLSAAALTVPSFARGEAMAHMPPRTASESFNPDVDIELACKTDSVRILSGDATKVWRYAGNLLKGPANTLTSLPDSYLGPVMRFVKGQKIRIRLKNELPEPTITHWHGLHVPMEADGHPMAAIDPGQTYVYEFEMRNRAGFNFYHPHTHEATATQVYRGLAGGIIVEDEEERALGLPSGEFEIPIVLQDRSFTDDNQLFYGGGMHRSMFGFYGDSVLVNGRPDFRLDVASRAYRLRILNGSNARIYKLQWDDRTPLTIIGVDGGLLEKPETRPYAMMAPGARLDLWVDFSGRSVGSKLVMRSGEFDGLVPPMAQRMSGGLIVGDDYPLFTVTVTRAMSDSPKLPEKLSTIKHHRPEEIANRDNPRPIALSMGHMQVMINGRTYSPDELLDNERVPVDTVQLFEVFHDHGGGMGMGRMGMGHGMMGGGMMGGGMMGGMGMGGGMMGRGMMGGGMGMMGMMNMAHPVHLHGQPFEVLSRSYAGDDPEAYATFKDGLIDSGLKDTIIVTGGERLRIAKPFGDFKGRFMYHCHNLEHEDMGMMREFSVE
ncbi:multicopper oxidase family protein [Methylocystis sp. Sn-Cys]|uniref:multicopper oxidase family protein n=1 Tax=Methylocystis sp. Sn-Cys TaxID=1701263 RepID=UPI0019217954|nr:multicopper oxidase domain-containing protein [Methylocystis sp. Sn-Cys]MBL1257620.1 multicopper oxidase domain-containing protein [Methylocystis sp. Sn-Cys]